MPEKDAEAIYEVKIHKDGSRTGKNRWLEREEAEKAKKGEKIMSDGKREMPRYRSHKIVHALKIAKIDRDAERAGAGNRETDGSALLFPAEDGYGPIRVDHSYMRKHDPKPGGYYVVYKDGYKSFSPAEAFEEGYTRI